MILTPQGAFTLGVAVGAAIALLIIYGIGDDDGFPG